MSRRSFFLVALGVVLTLMHLSLGRGAYSLVARLAGAGLAAACLWEYRLYMTVRDTVPVTVLASVQLYVFFGLPQFTQDGFRLRIYYYAPSESALTLACVLALAAQILFVRVYRATSHFSAGPRKSLYAQLGLGRVLDRPLPALIYAIPAALMYAVNALRPEYVPVTIRFLGMQVFNVYLAQQLLLYFAYARSDKGAEKQAYLLTALMSFLGFVQGVTGSMVFPWISVVLAHWVWQKRFRYKMLVAALLAVMVMNPVKNQFRRVAWTDKDISSIDEVLFRLEVWSDSFESVWGETAGYADPLEETTSRTSELLPFAHVIDLVPAAVPHQGWRVIESAVLQWVPRVLWPGKETLTSILSNEFAMTFGYSTPESIATTTVSPSLLGEGYWYFGILGVLLVASGQGMVFGFLFGTRITRNARDVMIVCLVYIGAVMLFITPFAATVASVPIFFVGVAIAARLLSFIDRLVPSSAPTL